MTALFANPGVAFEAPSAFAPLTRVARRELEGPWTNDDRRFALRCFKNDATNFAVLKNRNFQGFIVTAKNSGTHWLTYALNLALAEQYGVPPPRYSDSPSSDDIIGHPKHGRAFAHLPRIASTHSIPHRALSWSWVHRAVSLPRYVVVVRDVRDALASYYVKWRSHYQVPFETYVAGDPAGAKFRCDVWWYVHFLNRWGEMATSFPDDVLVVRYEDLVAAPAAGLESIAAHLRLKLEPRALESAVKGSSKEAMLARRNPANNRTVIRFAAENPSFTAKETAVFRRILSANLRYDFGYDYWPAGA